MVSGRGPLRVERLVAAHGPDVAPLCQACVAHLPGIAGAGVTMMAASAAQQQRCASDEVSDRVEQLQLLLGEGPCRDATVSGRPVLAEDLRDAQWRRRWPAFAGAAMQAGAAAVFALPLRADGAPVGVLDLYRASPGALAGQDLADALVFAAAITDLLLAEALSDIDAGPGVLERQQRAVVHQATGMASVQLGVSAEEAFMRLRAHAFAAGHRLDDVAAAVVARRLRFVDELGG